MSSSASKRDAERGELEQKRVLGEARERRQRMERDARQLVDQELKAMRDKLLRETVESAVKSAAETLSNKLTPADQERLAEEYVSGLARAAGTLRGGVSASAPSVSVTPSDFRAFDGKRRRAAGPDPALLGGVRLELRARERARKPDGGPGTARSDLEEVAQRVGSSGSALNAVRLLALRHKTTGLAGNFGEARCPRRPPRRRRARHGDQRQAMPEASIRSSRRARDGHRSQDRARARKIRR